MSRTIPTVALCSAVLVAMAFPSPASAFCDSPQPVQHILEGYFAYCPDVHPVQGYAYVLGQEAVNTRAGTSSLDIVCEEGLAQTQVGHICQPEAGIAGDQRVTVTFDWGGPPFNTNSDCPNPAGVPGVGRNVVQVMANDGSQVLMTVGYSVAYGAYILEMAHPGGGFDPIPCSQNNGLTFVSSSSSATCVMQTAPHIWSDCDPGAGGTSGGDSCQADIDPTPTVAPGNLYTFTGPCNATPNLLRAGWQPLSTTPGPGGSKCAVINQSGFDCTFIGGSSIIGGVETDMLTGYVRGACLLGCAAVDHVAIRKAEVLQGRLRVDFGTENETTIVGFNVYAGASRLNAGLIAAQGTGSNDYSFVVGRGALRNDRSITVEAVKSDGTSVRSDAVLVK